MKAKYQAGQYVYTTKKIHGWFDRSMHNYISENTVGTVVAIINHEPINDHEVEYLVRFGVEFGEQIVGEGSLKLG